MGLTSYSFLNGEEGLLECARLASISIPMKCLGSKSKLLKFITPHSLLLYNSFSQWFGKILSPIHAQDIK